MSFLPPLPPETMLAVWKSTCDNRKISRARQLQVSHKRTNIVLGGKGEGGYVYVATMAICRGKWFCYQFFLSVPRTFAEYCSSVLKEGTKEMDEVLI